MAKRCIILLFSLYFLCFSTEIHEVFRIPLLVVHYLEHQTEDKELAFADFLEEHYLKGEGVHSPDAEFPFEHQQHSFVSVLGILQSHAPFRFIAVSVVEQVQIPNGKHFLPKIKNEVWRPPQKV